MAVRLNYIECEKKMECANEGKSICPLTDEYKQTHPNNRPTVCMNYYILHKCVQQMKPQLGCTPYYVHNAFRIHELCDAIKNNSDQPENHNKIKLWATELIMLNEMDRTLRRAENEKTFIERKDGTLEELK